MTSNSRNVYAAEPMATGGVIVFPLGTPPPAERTDTDGATVALPSSGIDLGHIGEDGVTETRDRAIDRKRNWGGKVVKILQTEFTHTLKFTFLESLNANVLRMVYGPDNVDVTSANGDHGTQIVIRKNAKKMKRFTWCIDSLDSELGAHVRDWLFQAQIVTVGDVTVVHSDILQYEIELEAFEDPEGDHGIQWIDDGNPNADVIEELDGEAA